MGANQVKYLADHPTQAGFTATTAGLTATPITTPEKKGTHQ